MLQNTSRLGVPTPLGDPLRRSDVSSMAAFGGAAKRSSSCSNSLGSGPHGEP